MGKCKVRMGLGWVGAAGQEGTAAKARGGEGWAGRRVGIKLCQFVISLGGFIIILCQFVISLCENIIMLCKFVIS